MEVIRKINERLRSATMTQTVCCVCGQTAGRILTRVDRAKLPISFRLCSRCATVRIDPCPDQAFYDWFYSTGAYREVVRGSTAYQWTMETAVGEQEHFVKYVIDAFDHVLEPQRGGTLLEVGGSVGYIANYVKDRWGLRPTLVEPSEQECKHAESLLGPVAYNTTIEKFAASTECHGQYDVVMMWRTAEHILDIRAMMQLLRRLTGNVLLVDIVNFPPRYAGHHHRVCKIDHPWNFHLQSFAWLAEQCGLKLTQQIIAEPHIGMVFEPCENIERKTPLCGPGHVARLDRKFFQPCQSSKDSRLPQPQPI